MRYRHRHVFRKLAVAACLCWMLATATPSPINAAAGATSATEVARPPRDAWRRTRLGWERVADWPRPRAAPYKAVAFHPGLLAILQLMLSTGALLIAERR